jgi:hypothetical protein
VISCGVCVRKEVLDKIGGFRDEFFRKAGEYDFSFRIWETGYRVERFEDLVYRHDKVLTDRDLELSHRMDLRNNLILAERFLPDDMRVEYRPDWIHRYSAFAKHDQCEHVVEEALREAKVWENREREAGRQLLTDSTMETVFQRREQARLIESWAARHRIQRVIIDNYSKNILATYRGCHESSVEIIAVLDAHPAFDGLEYRGLPIVSFEQAKALMQDGASGVGVILSNVNPAQMKTRLAVLREQLEVRVLGLWEPRQSSERGGE